MKSADVLRIELAAVEQLMHYLDEECCVLGCDVEAAVNRWRAEQEFEIRQAEGAASTACSEPDWLANQSVGGD